MPPDAIDSLYEVPPAEFVKARNALVKSLKSGGQREAAERAAKLTRPTASVWASNQVARRDPKLVARLTDATEKLQGGVARDKARYAAAINTHRELLNELRQRIEAVLQDGGLRDAPATVGAAVQNFRSGLMDERLRPLLERGRLEEDVGLDAGGGVFGVAALGSAVEEEKEEDEPKKEPRAPAHRADHDGHARERERERREHERARAKARAEAERRVHALREAADAAAARRTKQEAAVAAARRELDAAERELRDAQAAEQKAAAALATAQADLEKLPA